MADFRFGRGWPGEQLQDRLARLQHIGRNFTERSHREMAPSTGWRAERSEAVVAQESPGPPLADGLFARAKDVLAAYQFSDPTIVEGHFDPRRPLLGRRMLLEIKVLGQHYLCGVVVGAVHDAEGTRESTFGFRYETLQGHLERGSEWFVLTKDHASGILHLRIESRWRPGDLPHWWTRAGFAILAPYYRKTWLRRCHERLCALIRQPAMHREAPPTRPLVHAGPPTRALPVVRPPAPERREAVMLGAALGALTGVRSMAAPATLALYTTAAGPQPGAGWLEHTLGRPGLALVLAAAAGAEMAADKTPWIPARVAPPALGGRLALGAGAGHAVAARGRHPSLAAALAGGLSAGLFATAASALRTRLPRPASVLLGFVEDVLVVAGSVAIRRALTRSDRPPYVIERTEEQRRHPRIPLAIEH